MQVQRAEAPSSPRTMEAPGSSQITMSEGRADVMIEHVVGASGLTFSARGDPDCGESHKDREGHACASKIENKEKDKPTSIFIPEVVPDETELDPLKERNFVLECAQQPESVDQVTLTAFVKLFEGWAINIMLFFSGISLSVIETDDMKYAVKTNSCLFWSVISTFVVCIVLCPIIQVQGGGTEIVPPANIHYPDGDATVHPPLFTGWLVVPLIYTHVECVLYSFHMKWILQSQNTHTMFAIIQQSDNSTFVWFKKLLSFIRCPLFMASFALCGVVVWYFMVASLDQWYHEQGSALNLFSYVYAAFMPVIGFTYGNAMFCVIIVVYATLQMHIKDIEVLVNKMKEPADEFINVSSFIAEHKAVLDRLDITSQINGLSALLGSTLLTFLLLFGGLAIGTSYDKMGDWQYSRLSFWILLNIALLGLTLLLFFLSAQVTEHCSKFTKVADSVNYACIEDYIALKLYLKDGVQDDAHGMKLLGILVSKQRFFKMAAVLVTGSSTLVIRIVFEYVGS